MLCTFSFITKSLAIYDILKVVSKKAKDSFFEEHFVTLYVPVCVWVYMPQDTVEVRGQFTEVVFSTVHVLGIELRSSVLKQTPLLGWKEKLLKKAQRVGCKAMYQAVFVRTWTRGEQFKVAERTACAGAELPGPSCVLVTPSPGTWRGGWHQGRGFGRQLGQCCIKPFAWHVAGVECVWLRPCSRERCGPVTTYWRVAVCQSVLLTDSDGEGLHS